MFLTLSSRANNNNNKTHINFNISQSLERRDSYVNLITSLRFRIADRLAGNALLLPYTEQLLPIAMAAFEADPGGFTGPELISMWSSMAFEEGWWAVQAHMAEVPAAVAPVCTSDSVAAVVAVLLLVNITQAAPDTCALLQAAPQCMQQLFLAFDGLHCVDMCQ